MPTHTNLLPVKSSSAVSTGLCFIAIASVLLMNPAINPLLNVQAAIDETMPDAIPSEILADWKDQDGTNYASTIAEIKTSYPEIAHKITGSGEDGYKQACHWRRVARMKPFDADLESIMFARHHNLGGLHVGGHDNTANGNDPGWVAKSALCVLNMKNFYSSPTELLTKTDAVVRDPCISFDGKRVLFALSGATGGSGYKIYEMEIANPSTVKQLTFDPAGMVVADFEPCYLPNGDIMFTSTRNFGLEVCAGTPTTNMFLMNSQGLYLRQVGFDQANTFYPVVTDDGTVLYTRGEYNDRSITNSGGLFEMNPDGCRQTECFGNQTGWPYYKIHARPIPTTLGSKIICVAGGYHGPYSGELMIINRTAGTNGKECIRMIAPPRETKQPADKNRDQAFGGVNFLFQNPWPLDEEHFLVSWRKTERVTTGESNIDGIYRLFFMDVDGNRELIAWADQSVSQPVPVKARKTPPIIVPKANYKVGTADFTMTDVYSGDGMKGIARGTAKSLRVVRLHYRTTGKHRGVLTSSNMPETYSPAVFVPVSTFGASWQAKEVLGEATIYPDGSAAFTVPARTPVYFQVLDDKGYCIATMRSWSTLMPGETLACMGCHESNHLPPPTGAIPQAGTPQKLDTPLGIENKPFDYGKMVQPIFNKNCVSCHTAKHESGFDLTGSLVNTPSGSAKTWTTSYISLMQGTDPFGRNKAINFCSIFSEPEQQPPRSFGSYLSGIFTTGGMSGNHHDVNVTEIERKIVACWIDLCAPHAGTYNSYMSASDSTTYQTLQDKRLAWAAIEKENIAALLTAQTAVLPDIYGTGYTKRTSIKMSRIQFFPKQRELVLNNPGEGAFILVDLRGTVIARSNISNKHTGGTHSMVLSRSLSKGIYIARFEGVSGVQQRMISLTK